MPRQTSRKEIFLGEIPTVMDPGENASDLSLSLDSARIKIDAVEGNERTRLCVAGSQGQVLGHLPDALSDWITPLLTSKRIRLEVKSGDKGQLIPQSQIIPILLLFHLTEHGGPILQFNASPRNEQESLHELVRETFAKADQYTDPIAMVSLCRQLVDRAQGEVLPETRLLLALLTEKSARHRDTGNQGIIRAARNRLTSLRISEPAHYKNLTLFPLAGTNGHPPLYALLKPAIEKGEVQVEEVSTGGNVPELAINNIGALPLLIPEGEILIGAKQNRTVNMTVMVAAHSRFVLPVSCVERGRWRSRSQFASSAYYSPPTLRANKMRSVHRNLKEHGHAASDQGEVWRNVDAQMEGLRAHSPTSSLTDGFESSHSRLDDYRKHFHLPKDAMGILFARGDRVIGMDLFDSHASLEHFWERIADAYFLEALCGPEFVAEADEPVAYKFLHQVAERLQTTRQPLGIGNELMIDDPSLTGSGVWYSDHLCHLAAFNLARG